MSSKWNPISTAPHGKRLLLLFTDGDMAVASFQKLSENRAVYGWVLCQLDKQHIVAKDPLMWADLPRAPAKSKPKVWKWQVPAKAPAKKKRTHH